VSSALTPNDCEFVGYGQDLSLPLDSNGTLSVNVRLTTKSGDNKILMDAFEGKILLQISTIKAMAANMPYSMTGTISNGGVLLGDGIQKFTIDYSFTFSLSRGFFISDLSDIKNIFKVIYF
jgi:hypothetical protein